MGNYLRGNMNLNTLMMSMQTCIKKNPYYYMLRDQGHVIAMLFKSTVKLRCFKSPSYLKTPIFVSPFSVRMIFCTMKEMQRAGRVASSDLKCCRFCLAGIDLLT